jgi:hypothetical protein
MKFSAGLSILALGLAQAKVQEAQQLEKSFERALGEAKRDLHECCTWVCEEPEPEPEYYYRSKAMMKSGSGSYYSRRANEVAGEHGRKLWYEYEESNCSWDCSSCEEPDYDMGGYMCLPTVTSPDDCECTCCGFLPEPEPEPEPCYYRSKAMMMGGSWYDDDGEDCGYYRSKGMMGYSRRTKETTAQQGERALPGKGWGGGWGGITCSCECDVPEYRSKAMMKSGSGSMKSSMASGSMYYDY